ncbi:MAG: hypothetical protein GY861_19215, partial [bacterium]|nr:hypothetical protein [bacterium]
MNASQVSSKAMSSCVTIMPRVVTLGADEEFKQEATQDKSDRSKGEVDYEKLKPMFHSSLVELFSNSPPTTLSDNLKQVSEIAEKSVISGLVLEVQELRSGGSKRMDPSLVPIIFDAVQNMDVIYSIQSLIESEESSMSVLELLKSYQLLIAS